MSSAQTSVLNVVAGFFWGVALIGMLGVFGSLMARGIKRLIGLSDETVNDPWFRRNDTAGMWLGVHLLRPALAVMVVAGVIALLLEQLK